MDAYTWTIGDWYALIEHNPNLAINLGFAYVDSYRGYYDQGACAVEYPDDNNRISELKEHLDKLTSGDIFCGYKGGEYTYNRDNYLFFVEDSAWTYTQKEMLENIFGENFGYVVSWMNLRNARVILAE